MTIEQLGPYWDDSFRKKPLDAERLLRLLGATGKLVGFRYTIYMLECIVADPSRILLITKSLYPDTARQFHTSAVSVERALRTLIQICWLQADHRALDHVAGMYLRRMPTNSEFLDILAAYLRAVQ